MSIWLLAVIALLPPLFVPLAVAMRADASNRLVALQMATGLAAFILALMSFAFDQSSFIDIALCTTLLAVPGTFLFATFMDRWL